MKVFRSLAVVALLMTIDISPIQAQIMELGSAASSLLQPRAFGSVYTATNGADGNKIETFFRLSNGAIFPIGAAKTFGLGTGGGLGNQSGITLTPNGRWLVAVNAGSNTISVFFVGYFGELYLTDVEPSGGERPVSVTTDGSIVFVLNGAGTGSIQGFKLGFFGDLTKIPKSNRPLSGAATTAPAQIQFSPDGTLLVVTEKATNLIDVYRVNSRGVVNGPVVHPSNGMTPFGFDINSRNQLIVSEAAGGAAGASTISSYSLAANGTLNSISHSVPNGQSASCWVKTLGNGQFAYVTNTGSGNVSGFAISQTGELILLPGEGAITSTGDGSTPIDIASTSDEQFVYVLNSGTHEILGFKFNPADGSLTRVSSTPGLPVGTNGLVAR